MDEILKEVLDAKLRKLYEQPLIRIIYFAPDAKIDGGKYMTVLERIKRTDESTQAVQTASGLIILFKDIYELKLLEESG